MSFLFHLNIAQIGKNVLSNFGKRVALFLHLKEPERYTGHCWRRTGITLAANAGLTIPQLKVLSGHKSDTVVQGKLSHFFIQYVRFYFNCYYYHLFPTIIYICNIFSEYIDNCESTKLLCASAVHTSPTVAVSTVVTVKNNKQPNETKSSDVPNDSVNESKDDDDDSTVAQFGNDDDLDLSPKELQLLNQRLTQLSQELEEQVEISPKKKKAKNGKGSSIKVPINISFTI